MVLGPASFAKTLRNHSSFHRVHRVLFCNYLLVQKGWATPFFVMVLLVLLRRVWALSLSCPAIRRFPCTSMAAAAAVRSILGQPMPRPIWWQTSIAESPSWMTCVLQRRVDFDKCGADYSLAKVAIATCITSVAFFLINCLLKKSACAQPRSANIWWLP